MNTERKPVIFIAGDSTAQSYKEEARPQTGWGELLLSALKPEEEILEQHRENCPFEQEKRYESSNLIVDNCAMAGRSSKTFREEGRLEDIKKQLLPGDFLLIQFGHNDASCSKPERYVPLEAFQESIGIYIKAAEASGAIPILVSSIALRPCPENDKGDVAKIGKLLPLYAKEMETMARAKQLAYIDLSKLTRDYCQQVGNTVTKTWYREDNVHLVEAGAREYARILAKELKIWGILPQ